MQSVKVLRVGLSVPELWEMIQKGSGIYVKHQQEESQ